MDKKITFIWREKDKELKKEVDKGEVSRVFESIARGFYYNNEVAEKIIKDVLPVTDTIIIDKWANDTQDVPYISYVVGGENRILKIRRRQRIIWYLLNDYFK